MSYWTDNAKVRSTTHDVEADTSSPQVFTRGDILTWRYPEEMDPRDDDIDDRLTGDQ